jgi:PhzF family phenazine biosynthesis protein
MMKIPLYQVDAFTERRFHGNPAAICPLEEWLPDSVLQAIATENNFSETAFYVQDTQPFHLRWFTPAVEVDLCGHATLASAMVILDVRKEVAGSRVEFATKSGALAVEKDGDRYAMDFPARTPLPCNPHPDLTIALGAEPLQILAARDYLCVYSTEDEVRALQPEMMKLASTDRFAVIATAPGSDCDFVSRFFAPAQGVPEDPVTGSAHCTLIPYWSQRLSKKSLFARQISARGGELWCELRDDRVRIAGHAVLYLEGTIQI